VAESREEFRERLAALADLVTPTRVERAIRESLRAVKGGVEEGRRGDFAALLPSWLRDDWEELAIEKSPLGPLDLVEAMAASGGYPYRAAAERDLTAFLAALRESVAAEDAAAMRPLLPEAGREMFDHAASCAYDASVREFL